MASERITIIVEERGTRVVQRRLADIGTTAKTSSGSVDFLRRSLLALGGIAVIRSAVGTLAQFEQAMATVRGITGATEQQFRELTLAARELGATTRFTATEAASGLVFLARAGFTVEESLATIRGTLQLAQAGALDFGRAADIVTNILRGFRLSASEVGRAIDVVALAANRTNSNVVELGDAMKFAAPVAAGTGVAMETVTAAVGALSDAGLKASLAGTGLRRVISELEAPNTKTVRILKNLGLTTQEVRVSQVGLIEALDRLRAAGLTTGQALEVFGDRGGPAFEVLSANLPNVRRLTKLLEEAGGTAEEIARIMDDNLNGALLAVRSRFEAVILAMGELGSSSLLTGFMRGLADLLATTAANAEILASALVGLAIGAIPRLIRALRALAVAIAGTGIGAIAVVVGAAIGALVAFRHEIRLSEDRLATLGDLGQAAFELVGDGLDVLVRKAREQLPLLGLMAEGLFGDLEFSLEGFLRFAARGVDLLLGAAKGAVNAATTLFRGFKFAALEIAVDLVNGIIGLAELMADTIAAILLGLTRTLVQGATSAEAAIRKLGTSVKLLFEGDFVGATAQAAQAMATTAIASGDMAARIKQNIGGVFTELAADQVLPRVANPLKGQARRLGEDVGIGFLDGFLEVGQPFEDALDDLLSRADQIAQERLAAEAAAAAGRDLSGIGRDAPINDPVITKGFENALNVLREQQQLLIMTARAREIHSEVLRIENELLFQNIELTDEQRQQLRGELERLHMLQQLSVVLDDVRGSELDLIAAQAELNRQVAIGAITAEQARQAYLQLQAAVLDMDKTALGGLRRGFATVREDLQDFARVTENALVSAFQNAEDAFVKFARTGQISFREFVDAILSDLARLAFRQAASGLIESLMSGFNFGGAREHGGPVLAGRTYLVGEAGPELVRFPSSGHVIPNKELVSMDAGGPGESTVINVTFNIRAQDAADVRRNARSVERDFVMAIRRGAERR